MIDNELALLEMDNIISTALSLGYVASVNGMPPQCIVNGVRVVKEM